MLRSDTALPEVQLPADMRQSPRCKKMRKKHWMKKIRRRRQTPYQILNFDYWSIIGKAGWQALPLENWHKPRLPAVAVFEEDRRSQLGHTLL